MNLIRYKNLSQFVDFTNLYTSMQMLGEIFMFGEEYFVFLKVKTSNDVYLTRETFAGDFKAIKIPFQSWGVTVDRLNLLKYYANDSLGINLICAQINSEQYVTILINSSDQISIFVDNNTDSTAMAFMHSACPLTCVSSLPNWTIVSFDNTSDGTDSWAIASTSLDWSSWNSTNPVKFSSLLTSTPLSATAFNLLITDPSSGMVWIYSTQSGNEIVHVSDLGTLNNLIFNQVTDSSAHSPTIDLTSLTQYLEDDFSNSLVLVFFNNNSMVFYDKNTGDYIYKNLFAHWMVSGFNSTQIFSDSTVRFNLFKQMLMTFNGISDVSKYRLGKALISSNIFMTCESNLAPVQKTANQTSIVSYFTDVEESSDLSEVTAGSSFASMSRSNYTLR